MSSDPVALASASRHRPGAAAAGADRLTAASVTWLGHATTLVELDGVRLITDPALRARMGPLVRVTAPVSPADYDRVDAVLLSHLHSDHADLPSLRVLGKATRVIAPVGAGAWLARRGFTNVEEIAAGSGTAVGPVAIEATSAAHQSRRQPFGPHAQPVGYVMRASRSVYFAGDTDIFGEMGTLAGSVHLALLPVWGWGASVGPGHLDPESAAAAAGLIGAEVTVPIHWGTYALAHPLRAAQRPRPPRSWAPQLFAALAARQRTTRVVVLEPGDQLELSTTTTGRSLEWQPQQATG
jgi:L-ascorbate metabolism protein UlaG (beta-lactamase superfamily)